MKSGPEAKRAIVVLLLALLLGVLVGAIAAGRIHIRFHL